MTDDLAAVAGFVRSPAHHLEGPTRDVWEELIKAGYAEPQGAGHRARSIVQVAHLEPDRDAAELVRAQVRPAVLDEDVLQRIATVVRGVQETRRGG